jgi:hypothetical protein
VKKAKKTKASARETALDRLAARVRAALRRESENVIEIGNLLIKCREHLEHGEWQPWLAENFDLSLRSAQNYYTAAEYVARATKGKSATVADFENLAPTVLYRLAGGHYDEREEAEILAEAKAGKRVDQDKAWAIREALAPAAADDDDAEGGDAEDGGEEGGDDGAEVDAESEAILDGPPPEVPPPAPNAAPPDFALKAFDQAIGALKPLVTKPSADFAGTIHGADDLEKIESFIRAVVQQLIDAVKRRRESETEGVNR